MEYRTLGRTGLKVSSFCLGTMLFGNFGGSGNRDLDACVRIIHRALDHGVNFVDTADMYSAGESETIVGAALSSPTRRSDVVLSTKVGLPMGEDPNQRGASRRWIVRAVEDSLRRLGTDWIDLYQLHRPDPTTNIDETLAALSDLVREGKIRYLGTSTFPAHQIVEAQWVSEKRGHRTFATEQPPYSIMVRAIENDVLPVCRQYDLGVMAWSPLNGGWLTGRYRKDAPVPTSGRTERLKHSFDLSRPENRRKFDAADALGALAATAGLSLITMALAFVVRHPAVTTAIIGPRTIEHLDGLLAAEGVKLDEALLDQIDAIVPPGINLDPADAGWRSPSLEPAARRR